MKILGSIKYMFVAFLLNWLGFILFALLSFIAFVELQNRPVIINEAGIKFQDKAPSISKVKSKVKKVKISICGKHSLFERFNKIHWPYYVENECGDLKNLKCCHTMKNDTGGYTCYGVSINNNNEFYKLIDKFIKKKEKGDFDIEPYAKLQIYSKYFKGSKIANLHPKSHQAVFDYAVHSGISPAVKELQKNVGVKADGKIGPNTIKASRTIDLDKYWNSRAKFLRSIDVYKSHPSGMERRLKNAKEQPLKSYNTYLKECAE